MLSVYALRQVIDFSEDLKILDLFNLGPHSTGCNLHPGHSAGRALITPSNGMTVKTGVVVHLHYTDVWPDIEVSLRNLPGDFGLIVTLSAGNAEVERLVKRSFPQAEIRVVSNVGRDVRPFLELLDDGSLDRFDIVCKLHGKKSVRNGKPTVLGERWRRAALNDLIAGPGRFEEALARFADDPQLGMLGPARFRIPNERFSLHDAWSGNRSETLRIAERLGFGSSFDLDFFAGTMFWARPAALARLRGAGLGEPAVYSPEAGLTDGAVEYALERLFTTSVIASGFKLGALEPAPDVRF